ASSSTIIPDSSWTCGMSSGIPPPELGTFVLNATLQLSGTYDAGNTPYGKRRAFVVSGGSFNGPRVSGTFATGGLDLELTLSNGQVELEQVNILKTSDGTQIYLRTCGVAPSGQSIVRVVLDFEVPNSASSLTWLNTGKFVGTRSIIGNTIQLSIYDVSNVQIPTDAIRLTDPQDVPNQTWECFTLSGSRGNVVFSETVSLGASVSIGASKRGTRNIIPITGGPVTGKVTGVVINGGADYQLITSGSTTLDARYLLKTNDNEIIVVRNCGPFGKLVPVFETREAGPYSFLNRKVYLSADPVSSGNSVGITFYALVGQDATTTRTTTSTRTMTSTTKTTTTSKSPSPSSNTCTGLVAVNGQCGGKYYSGSNCCASGSTCTFKSDFYSQCVELPSPSPSISPSPTIICQPQNAQCGGQYFTGVKCCVSGYTCTVVSQWYSQCK
ncbi:hypothetical protein HK098_007082, partial [Nowakowskiella sp. JEL0407]